MRSVNQKDCKCGCGKIRNCEECGLMIQGQNICIYHKKPYCKECLARIKRRGA